LTVLLDAAYVPSGQSSHPADPENGAAVPGGQSTHRVVLKEYLPLAHSTQSTVPWETAIRPGKQSSQSTLLSTCADLPTAQRTQPVAFSLSFQRPEGHGVQEACPVRFPYFPLSQAKQLSTPGCEENLPIGQSEQSGDPSGSVLYVP